MNYHLTRRLVLEEHALERALRHFDRVWEALTYRFAVRERIRNPKIDAALDGALQRAYSVGRKHQRLVSILRGALRADEMARTYKET